MKKSRWSLGKKRVKDEIKYGGKKEFVVTHGFPICIIERKAS